MIRSFRDKATEAVFNGESPKGFPADLVKVARRKLRYLNEDVTMAKKLKPMHPGEVLREEFLVPLKMSAGALARACGLPRTRIERIASEQTGITADTALRLAKALGTTSQLWLNLQNDYDVQIAKRDIGKILDRIETVNKPKAA